MTEYKREAEGVKLEVWHDHCVDNPRTAYEYFYNVGVMVCRSHRSHVLPSELDGFRLDDWETADEAIKHLKAEYDAVCVLPVWMYDHGDVALSAGEQTYPFTCGWDSSFAGLIFATRESLEDWPDWTLDKVEEVLKAEVRQYSQWANGECYGFTITCPDGDHDYDDYTSYGGFIGWEYAKSEADSAFDHEVKAYVERRDRENLNRQHWAERDVVTVGGAA